jgi:hypothetical protein
MSNKLRPPVIGDPAMQRVLEELYDHINRLKDSVNQSQVGATKQTEGKAGDTRIVEGNDGEHYLEVRTNKGWKRTAALADQPKESK